MYNLLTGGNQVKLHHNGSETSKTTWRCGGNQLRDWGHHRRGDFVSPSSVLAGAGASVGISLCIWAFGGLISYCGALSYAELGTRLKKSGGSYTYVRAAYGNFLGFLVLWAQLVVVRPLAAVLGSLVTAEYIIRAFYIDCPDLAPKSAKVLLGTVVLGFLVMCNCLSVKASALWQTLSTVCKVSALFVIIVTGLAYLGQGNHDNFDNPFNHEPLTVGGVVMGFYAAFYAYTGWDHINNGVEEIKNPKRTIPIAILGGLTIGTLCFLLANIAYHAAMTNDEILSGVAVAVVFGEKLLGPFKTVLLPCIAISAAGVTNVIIFTSSRLNFAGGRDKIFPPFLGMVNAKTRTPIPTILLLFALAIVFLSIGDVKSIIGTYSLFRALPEAIAISGIIRIRKQYPDNDTVYKVPIFFPLIFVVLFGTISIIAFIVRPSQFLVPMVMVLLGVPVYYVSNSHWWNRGMGPHFNGKGC